MVVNVGPTRGSDQHGGEDAWGPVLQSGRPQPVRLLVLPASRGYQPDGPNSDSRRNRAEVCVDTSPREASRRTLRVLQHPAGSVTHGTWNCDKYQPHHESTDRGSECCQVVTARDGTWVCVCSVLVWGDTAYLDAARAPHLWTGVLGACGAVHSQVWDHP